MFYDNGGLWWLKSIIIGSNFWIISISRELWCSFFRLCLCPVLMIHNDYSWLESNFGEVIPAMYKKIKHNYFKFSLTQEIIISRCSLHSVPHRRTAVLASRVKAEGHIVPKLLWVCVQFFPQELTKRVHEHISQGNTYTAGSFVFCQKKEKQWNTLWNTS